MGSANQTRARILDAARQILARDGFAGLGVNALAAQAGVGKPLVYRYFGDMQGVVSALLSASSSTSSSVSAAASSEPGPEQAIETLIGYGRGLAGDRTRRDLLAWSLAAADGPALQELKDAPSLSAFGPVFGPASGSVTGAPPQTDRQAIMVLLQAAITFLLLCRDRHSAWAGMPLGEPRHMARLERALATIIRASYSEPEVTEQ